MCAILRLVYYPKTWDSTWEVWRAYVFGTLETNLAIFCVCVPQLRKLAGHVGSKIASSYNNSSGTGNNNNAANYNSDDGLRRRGPGAETSAEGLELNQARTSSKGDDDEDDTTPMTSRFGLPRQQNGVAAP